MYIYVFQDSAKLDEFLSPDLKKLMEVNFEELNNMTYLSKSNPIIEIAMKKESKAIIGKTLICV